MEAAAEAELREVPLRTKEQCPLASRHLHQALLAARPVCRARPWVAVPTPPWRRRLARQPLAVEEDASGAEISANHLQLELKDSLLSRQGSALLHPWENSIRE
jgi:hypothetical protein